MGRINKPNKTTPVSADEFIIYDSEDTSDDKNVTLGQIATFTESQNSTVTGTKIFTDGVELQKGSIAFGQYSPLPTGIGSYIAQYTHPTYGARLLGYNGLAYQDLNIGSMPTAGTVSMKSLANGDCDFGYNVNIAENLVVTGDITGANLFGTNTGDETANGIKTKLETLTTTSRLDASAIQDITGKYNYLPSSSYCAYYNSSASLSLSAGVITKLNIFTVKAVDSLNEFDIVNQKFISSFGQVVLASMNISMSSANNITLFIYKNGSIYRSTSFYNAGNTNILIVATLNANDYLEFYISSPVANTVTSGTCYVYTYGTI